MCILYTIISTYWHKPTLSLFCLCHIFLSHNIQKIYRDTKLNYKSIAESLPFYWQQWWWRIIGKHCMTIYTVTLKTTTAVSIAQNNSWISWWRHQMEICFVLLAFCAGNLPVPGEFRSQRPVTRSFDVFFDLCLNKQASKQSWGWWSETPPNSL